MNKYAKFSRASLTKNLHDPVAEFRRAKMYREANSGDAFDDFDNDHKETLEQMTSRVGSVVRVATQMMEVLHGSGLNAQGRAAAVQILNVFVNRLNK